MPLPSLARSFVQPERSELAKQLTNFKFFPYSFLDEKWQEIEGCKFQTQNYLGFRSEARKLAKTPKSLKELLPAPRNNEFSVFKNIIVRSRIDCAGGHLLFEDSEKMK